MKVRFILLLFLPIAIGMSCADSKEVRLQRFLDKGNRALEELNNEQAAYYFQEALKIDPCFADALNNLGTMSFRRKDFEGALVYYNKAVDCRPGFLLARFNRANDYYELKEYFNAMKDISKIIEQKPDTAAAHFLQGLVASKMRDYPLALSAFGKAVSLDSANVDYLVNHGTVNFYLHHVEEARKDLDMAMRINPSEPNIYNTLSLIEVSQNNGDLAYRHIEKALQLAPGEPYFINNRGYVLLMQNRLPEALADINQSILLDPGNGWAYRNKGIYHLLSGDYGSAIRLLKQGFEMDPYIDRIHFYLGMAYLKSRRQREACDEFEKSDRAGDKMTTPEILKSCR